MSTELTIKDHFTQFQEQATEWAEKAKTIAVTDVTQTDLMANAREARIALKNIRGQITKKHAELKEDSLRRGQMLDKVKRDLIALIEPTEKYLQLQEDFIEIQNEKRKKEIQEQRVKALMPYLGQDTLSMTLDTMSDEAFEIMLSGCKTSFEEKQEKDRLEAIRLENEQKEKEKENARIREENEQLKEYNLKVQKLTSSGFRWHEESNSYNHEGIKYGIDKNKLIKISKEEFQFLYDEIIPKVQEYTLSKQKLEREEQHRKEKEEDDRKAQIAAERKAKRAPDKVKLLEWANTINDLFVDANDDLTFKDEDAKKIFDDSGKLLAKVVDHIRKNAEKL